MPRKKPFSNKQKKKQLQEKRERKRGNEPHRYPGQAHRPRPRQLPDSSEDIDSGSDSSEQKEARLLNFQPFLSRRFPEKKYDPTRYKLHFEKETKQELAQQKKLGMQPFTMLPEIELEVNIEDIYQPGSVLDIPKRPPWDYTLSKDQVEKKEEQMFHEYLNNIRAKYSAGEVSYFECNLETWRQLWRVVEMSDVILLIADIRHPALHFSPVLYDYVVKELNKHLILVLNKIDLAPPSLVVAWRSYFREKYPCLHVICFTSFPKENFSSKIDPGKVLHRKRRRGAFSAVGPMDLLRACESICKDKVDLSSWRNKIESEVRGDDFLSCHPRLESIIQELTLYTEHEFFRDGVLTIGCVGHPNVGKSSLMNGLVGRKVVSTSRTPGHTKHFQTIFLTPTVKLCDCPGLVFPSVVDKQLQILSGIYPISQVQMPYTAVGYLAQRIPVVNLLKIRHPSDDASSESASSTQWSAWDICEAWAEKRGFVTAKAGRNDTYRAANNILRLAVEGRLCMCMRPPDYTKTKSFWENNPETKDIALLQAQHKKLQELSRIPCSDFTSSDNDSDADVESNDIERESDPLREDDEDEDEKKVKVKDPLPLKTDNPYSLLATNGDANDEDLR
ncbi:guanine nucleotide-binding protein-like 1 [Antedon mediterranea]|uniref:guanine nucleotide-binding protein-like 1 n=1 Tax=Antedon mediterranea TaxID=105859 RepID=UPI003AF95A7D